MELLEGLPEEDEDEQLAKLSKITGDGMYLVGPELTPGTYRATNSGGDCYWERLANATGSGGNILANGNETGPVVVQILATDYAFSTKRCGEWNKLN